MYVKSIATFTVGLALSTACLAASHEAPIQLEQGGATQATLALPEAAGPAPVVLLVADGAAARPLAQALADQGIAAVRDVRADDVAAWITRLKGDARFDKVVVVGYGDNLLPALLAANQVGAGGFVALAGAGKAEAVAEFGKLHMHARIIQGDADVQAGVDDARKLEQGRPGTPVVIVQGMNHRLQGGGAAVAPDLVAALVAFANKR